MDRSHIPKRFPHGLWAGLDRYLSMNGSHPTSPDPVLEPHLGDRYVAGNGPRLSCAPWVAGATRRTTDPHLRDRKSTRLNSSHGYISYAVFCLKKKKKTTKHLKTLTTQQQRRAEKS